MNPTLPNRSFSEWYVDPTITGHALLEPSLFVGRTYMWVFSPLSDEGCCSLVDVINRLVIFILLPIAALAALLCLPFGLLIKGLASVSAVPTTPLPPPQPPEYATSYRESDHARIPSTVPTTPLPPPQPPEYATYYVESDRARVPAAMTTLESVEPLLQKAGGRRINIAHVDQAKRLFEGDNNLLLLMATTPPKPPIPDDPIQQIVEKAVRVQCWIDALQFRHTYYSRTMVGEGEIEVPADGNCLFSSFLQLGDMNGSRVLNSSQERALTMQWIGEHYSRDATLQGHLINSMAEHLFAKIERLEVERMGLLGGVMETVEGTARRLQDIENALASLNETTVQISEAFGNTSNDSLNFSAVQNLVPAYLEELSKDGEHGGAAELYALSCRHQVCIQVYTKVNGVIPALPSFVMNAHFTGKPVRSFTHSRNHYNVYCPKGL